MKTQKSATSPLGAHDGLQERTKKRRRTQKLVPPPASAASLATENPQSKAEEQPQEVERFHSAVGTEDYGLSPDLSPDAPEAESTLLLEDPSSRQPSGRPPAMHGGTPNLQPPAGLHQQTADLTRNTTSYDTPPTNPLPRATAGQSDGFDEVRGNEVCGNDSEITLVRVPKAVLRDLHAHVPSTYSQKTLPDPPPREVHICMLDGVPSLSAGYGQEPDPIDWERFFITFEGAASRRESLPKNRWVDVLRLHCDPSALDVLDTAMTELELDGLDTTDYDTLRDRMLFSREERYHPLTYLRQLLTLRQGERSASDLGIFLRKLRTHYERATVRHTKFERWEFPTICVGLWGLCYLEALHPDISPSLRAQCTMLDPTLPNYLHRLIRLATVVDKFPRIPDDKRASPPRPLACPTIPDRTQGDMRSKDGALGTPTQGTPRSTTRFAALLPCCFCGQHGHRHQTCEKYQMFRNNRRWARHACPKCLEKGHFLKECKQPRGKYWGKDEAAWNLILGLQYRALAEKRTMHYGREMPNWNEDSPQLSVVYSGTTLELKAGGWKLRDLGYLRLSPSEDRPAVIGGVGLRPSSYAYDYPDSERIRSLFVVLHYAAHPRLYSVADDDDLMWELEAVHALNLGLGHNPSTFDCPNRHKRNRDSDSHLACIAFRTSEQAGTSQPGSTDLSDFPKTCEALLQLCDSTETKLTLPQREQLKQLCVSYPEIWNAGDRRLATINLTKFSVTLKDGVEPYCQPPRTEPL
ncbi:hypothetical protein Emed_002709 [Eimeria media]